MITILAKALSGDLIKGLVAVWLGDKTILELGKDVATEAVGQKIDDVMQARKTSRMLAEIEDELLERIGTYLKDEFSSQKSGDLKLIVDDCVSYTSSEEFFDLCIGSALKPEVIFESFMKGHSGRPKELMVDRHTYANVSRFVVSHYSAFVLAMPKFEKSTLAQLLKDTDEIIDRLIHLEAKIVEAIEANQPDSDRNRRDFLRVSMKAFEKISIFGVDGRNSPKKYDLSVAYINLHSTNNEDDETVSTESRVSAALTYKKQLTVVLGEPGSGKTTLLSWLTLQIAKRRPLHGMTGPLDLLPIFIRLREYSEKDLPLGEDLLNQQLGVARDNIDKNWKKEQIESGRFLFLIDGLDELPTGQRSRIADWCRDLMQTWQNSKIIVSSRPYASRSFDELVEEFGSEAQTLMVEPMDVHQTELLIDHWYKSYANNLTDKDDYAKAKLCGEKLKNRLASSATLRSITKNPLICSLICFVNFDRDGFVPDERGELYSIAIDALVERRDRERGIRHDFEIGKAQKIKVLGYISEYFWMRSSSQVPVKDVVTYLVDYMPGIGIDSELTSELVSALAQRSHILRAPSDGVLDFSHKTFMEFFLAKRIVDLNLRERVSDNWVSPDFREVLYFVFALSTPIFLNDILSKLLEQNRALKPRTEEKRYSAIVLQTATSEAAEIAPDLREKIAVLLKDVLPPNSNSEADALARTGDAIVEPLSAFTKECYKSKWGFCVRALLNSYSEDAVYALGAYAKLGDPEIDKQLVLGRRLFEGDGYSKNVLRYCRTIQDFEIESHFDVELIGNLNSLKSLAISNFDDTWDDFSKVRNEGVRRVSIKSVDAVRDLAVLNSFPNTKELSVVDCHFVIDYSEISSLTKLTSLTIYSIELVDIGFLTSCRELEYLDISECTQVRDVKELNKLIRLRELLLPYSSLYDQISLSSVDRNQDTYDFDRDVFEDDSEEYWKSPSLAQEGDDDGYVGIPSEEDDERKDLKFDE